MLSPLKPHSATAQLFSHPSQALKVMMPLALLKKCRETGPEASKEATKAYLDLVSR